jgi:hypothetical protein
MRRFSPIVLLLSIFISSVGQTTNVSLVENPSQQAIRDVRPSSIPSELLGEWQARRGSGSSYYNPNSGSYGAPNGTIDGYKFLADGRYEHAILMQNSLYNCTTRVFGRETGSVSVDGDTLTITPGPGTLQYLDDCRPHLNSKKVTQLDEETWQWEVSRDDQGVKLCVRDEKGASACYYRQLRQASLVNDEVRRERTSFEQH